MTPAELAKSGTEHAHQRALFAWCAMAERYGLEAANDPRSFNVKGHAEQLAKSLNLKPIPALKWLHAIHNQGHGDAVRGGRAKAEGVKAGVADLFLPAPITKWNANGEWWEHGLYIEMKRTIGSKISEQQLEFADDMKKAGYQHRFCYGWQNARDDILEYLGLLN